MANLTREITRPITVKLGRPLLGASGGMPVDAFPPIPAGATLLTWDDETGAPVYITWDAENGDPVYLNWDT